MSAHVFRRAAALLVLPILVSGATACPGMSAPCADGGTCEAIALPTGTVPNDVRAGRCGDAPVALVPASFDARVDAIAHSGEVLGSVFMGVGTNPWAVAGAADALWVSLWSAGAVALLDVCGSRERGRLDVSSLVEVEPPVTLRTPMDADGDGAPDTLVRQMTPRTPQAIVARGAEAWVAFSNLLEASGSASEPPLFGPGVVARVANEDGAPVLRVLATVPCTNPQGLALEGSTLWVSCSGPLGPDASGRHGARADGALVAVDADTLEVAHVIDAGRFAPATPAIEGGRIAVGSLVTPRVALLRTDALSFDDAALVTLPGADVDSVFEVVLHADTVDAPVFSRDRIYSFSADAPPARVDDDGLLVGAGGDAPRGLLAVDMPDGADAGGLALLTLSAEVIVLSPASGRSAR